MNKKESKMYVDEKGIYSFDKEGNKVYATNRKEVTNVNEGNRILIIGDTHLPYEKEGYLEFCKKVYDEYHCNMVVHIGDVLDLHTTSRHPSLSDAPSPGDELNLAIEKLKKWNAVFPTVKVCIGNHDIRVSKSANDGHIASKWLKDFNEVLGVPGWDFQDHFEIDGTVYTHGTGTTGAASAHNRALNLGKNVVIGHIHTEASIRYHKLPDKTIFGMIVGSGVNQDAYGMNYAKNFPKRSIISCGVVINNQPIIKIMQ